MSNVKNRECVRDRWGERGRWRERERGVIGTFMLKSPCWQVKGMKIMILLPPQLGGAQRNTTD